MNIELPFPNKILWPNGGSSHNRHKVNRLKQKHRSDACYATMERLRNGDRHGQLPLQIVLTVHPKPRGPEPDEDNCVAACKAYLDGISDALKVNDRNFKSPVVQFGERKPYGAFVVSI